MSAKLEMFLKSKSKKNGNFEKYQKSLFVQISYKTSNVLQKDSKMEKINVTMIMIAEIEWVHVGKACLHPFVKTFFWNCLNGKLSRQKAENYVFYKYP